MALAKRLALERNQRRRKMLRMSKTERSTFPADDRFGLAPPFTAARSGPLEVGGGVEAIMVSCEAGERMRSTWRGEDMGVEDQGGWRFCFLPLLLLALESQNILNPGTLRFNDQGVPPDIRDGHTNFEYCKGIQAQLVSRYIVD
jgi:hypothetical protein